MKNDSPAESPLPPSHPDANLIIACINYSAARRAGAAAYDMDPTDNNDFAGEIDARFSRRMDKLRTFIAGAHSQTADGLRLKATVVDTVVTDFEADLNRWGIADILRSLANDVLQFHSGDRG